MTAEISETKPKIAKDGRIMSPASLANLKPPWQPGYKPEGAGGQQVTHWLKSILAQTEADGKPSNARLVAEKMVERSKILTGKSDASILTQLLDRTEGKVLDKHAILGDILIEVVYGNRYSTQDEDTSQVTDASSLPVGNTAKPS